jgi:hypothetical protein
VDMVEMTSSQREMPIVVGELGFNPRDVAREPLPVAKGNEAVLTPAAGGWASIMASCRNSSTPP